MAMQLSPRRSFQDLPAELRNQIYIQLFTVLRDGEIHIFPYRTQDNKIRWWYRVMPSGHLRFHTAVLRVCRAICEEATAILYGGNRYSFIDAEPLGIFIRGIGRNASLLRRVKLRQALSIYELELIKKCLKPATAIDSLAFWTLGQVPAAEAAKALGPLFRAWHKERKKLADNCGKSVLDVLQIKPSQKPARSGATTYEQDVKAHIAATLK